MKLHFGLYTVVATAFLFNSSVGQRRNLAADRDNLRKDLPPNKIIEVDCPKCQDGLRPGWKGTEFPGFCPAFFLNVEKILGGDTEGLGQDEDNILGQLPFRAEACLCEYYGKCQDYNFPMNCPNFFQRNVYGPRNCQDDESGVCDNACWALAYQCGFKLNTRQNQFVVDTDRQIDDPPMNCFIFGGEGN